MIFGKNIRFKSNLNHRLLFDILFTLIFVAIADEKLFRVLLFEELKLFSFTNKNIFLQSILFSQVHPYDFDKSFIINNLIKIDLFLLIIYLNSFKN